MFPTKTSMCPIDKDAYFGSPDLFTPQYDEVHISVTFKWDVNKGKRLALDWQNHGNVKIGGVAVNGESDQPFTSGMYLKKGITITSRGCPNHCRFCQVKNRLVEFDDFPEGNIIQDNNILACSDRHIGLVFSMLRNQRSIEFKGGLEAKRITPNIAEQLRGLRIKTLWVACDHPNAIKTAKKAIKTLNKAGFTQNNIYCYVLIGNDMLENENRLREVYLSGALPFAQLYRNETDSIKYSKEWKQFARRWSRPTIYKSFMRR